MLRDALKQEIDKLSELQLRKIADFVTSLKAQSQQPSKPVPFWQSATPAERSQDLRAWTAHLPKPSPSFSDNAFDRSSIYE
ncbi:hypothetical protein C7271_11105 [filamentous cyanobacterium CCP5]|nr:hypothetical protein C7271_11105 [filamentous cyanobacterium CCP5]